MPLRISHPRLNANCNAIKTACQFPHYQAQHAHSYYTNARLTNAHVVVTGGSRGIGKAIAARFASLNASTTIVGRNPDTLRAAVQEIASLAPSAPSSPSLPPSPNSPPSPTTHGFVAGDVSTKGFWEMLARSLVLRESICPPPASPSTSAQQQQQRQQQQETQKQKFDPSPVTVLVNAAGVANAALLVRQSAGAVEDVVQTNLMGTVWGCKVLGKAMLGGAAAKRRKAGAGAKEGEAEAAAAVGASIINVSSLLALQGGVGSAAYAASKAGVLGLTRALAGEMGPLGVRVNAIVPGYVETDMTTAMSPAAREKALERIPLKRFGTVDEVADAAVFLATNQFANNCVINLDGGMGAVGGSFSLLIKNASSRLV